MVRMLPLLTVVGGAGVLVAAFALQEGADAHPNAPKATNLRQSAEAPASAGPGIRVVHSGQVTPRAPGLEKPGTAKAGPERANVTTAPVASERNFLTRVGSGQGTQSASWQAPSDQPWPIARGDEAKPTPKALVERAPPMPASVDAKAREPIAPLRGSSPGLLASRESMAERAKGAAGVRLDLNTASPHELDGLAGGGLIGKAIVRGRPYASSEDLVRKQILSRATFDRIKTQVAVR